MIILTSRLLLRPFDLCDVNEFFEITRSEQIRKYVSYAYTEDKRELEANIIDYQNGDFKNDFYFVIEELNTMNIVGAIIATRTVKNNLEIAYLLGEKFRRKGYMTEAMKGFIQNVAIGLRYNLEFVIDSSNEASINTVKKLGTKFVYHNEYGNVYRYEV